MNLEKDAGMLRQQMYTITGQSAMKWEKCMQTVKISMGGKPPVPILSSPHIVILAVLHAVRIPEKGKKMTNFFLSFLITLDFLRKLMDML